MKKNTKNITIGLLALGLAVTSCGALAACTGGIEELPKFNYDYSKPTEDLGDGIVIDGKVDEAHWKEGRAFTGEVFGTNVTYKMMTYFGEKGVYFGWDIYDDIVYYHPDRDIYGNTGVELYVGSPEEPNMSYEIDLNACGKRMLRKWTGSRFMNWFSELHSAVVFDGTFGGECNGYTVELYLPYHLFNSDGSDTKHDTLLVNPVYIRGNDNANSDDKLWYSFGAEERGLVWGAVQSNFYRMTKGVGLEANDVTLTKEGEGTLTGRSYHISGDKYTASVQPAEGYYLESLKIGDTDVTDKLTYNNGVASASAEASGDFEVKAKFAPLSSTKHTFKGTVSTSEGELEGAAMYALYRAARIEIPVAADGKFEISLPEAEWRVYCSAQAALTQTYDLDIYEDVTHNFVLMSSYLDFDNPNFWNIDELGNGTVAAVGSDWLTGAVHNKISGTKVFASANIVLPAGGDGPRVGFLFETASKVRVFACLLWTNDTYRVQVIVNGQWGKYVAEDIMLDQVVGPEVAQLAQGNGVPTAALFDGGKLSMWVNGKNVIDNTPCNDSSFGISETTVAKPGIMITAKGVAFRNLIFNTTGFDEGYPISITKTGRGAVTVEGNKTTYQDGDTLKFHIEPNEGYVCTALTVNGKDVLADLSGGVLQVTPTAGMAVVAVDATFEAIEAKNVTVSGSVTYFGKAMKDIPVELKKEDGTVVASGKSAQDGSYTLTNVPTGVYTLVVNGDANADFKDAYLTVTRSLPVTDAVEEEGVALRPVQDTIYGLGGATEYFDISGLPKNPTKDSEGNITAFTGGKIVHEWNDPEGSDGHNNEQSITLNLHAAAGEDFWISANFRKQDSFDPAEAWRYGFKVTDGGWWIGATLVGNNVSDNSFVGTFSGVQLHNWFAYGGVGYYKENPLTDADRAALESEAGLNVAFARINNLYCTFYQRDGVWVLCNDYEDYDAAGRENSRPVQIGFIAYEPMSMAEFKNIEWKRGDIDIEVNVSKHENVTVAHNSPKLGENVVLTLTPESGMLPRSVKINGVEHAQDLVKAENVYTLTLAAYKSTRSIEVEATFAEIETLESLTYHITLHKLGIDQDNKIPLPANTKVQLVGTNTYTATVTEGVATFANVLEGEYALKIDGGYVDKAVTVSVGKTSDTFEVEWNIVGDQATRPESLDTTKLNDGELSYSEEPAGTESHVKTNLATGTGDFFFSSVIHKSSLYRGNYRVGYTFYDGSAQVQVTLVKSGEKFNLHVTNWGAIGLQVGTPAAVQTAFEGGSVEFAFARRSGVLIFLAKVDETWTTLGTLYNEGYSAKSINMGFAAWHGNSGSAAGTKWTNIRFEQSIPAELNTALAVTVEGQPVGATLTHSENPKLGDDVTLTFTVAAEKALVIETITVNEVNMVASLKENDGKLILVVPHVSSQKLTVVAKFVEAETANVTLKIDLHKLGIGEGNKVAIPDNTYITLTSDKTIPMNAASVKNGIATFNSIPKGITYTLTIEGYAPQTLKVDGEISEKEMTFDFIIATTVGDNINYFDTSKLNDGELSYSDSAAGESHLKIALQSGTGDFLFSAKLKKADTFRFADFRYGFTLYDGNSPYQFTLLSPWQATEPDYSTVKLKVQATNWVGFWLEKQIPTEVQTAWETDGIEFAVARHSGVLYFLAKTASGWTNLSSGTVDALTNVNFNMGFGVWSSGAKGATYEDITFTTEIPQDVVSVMTAE